MTEHLNDLRAAQRIDDRALFAPLRDYRNDRGSYIVTDSDTKVTDCYFTSRDDVGTAAHINTSGMSPAECCTEIGAEPAKIVRWNEGPDYPHGRDLGAVGLLVVAVSAVLSIAALVHLAGWLGWLS